MVKNTPCLLASSRNHLIDTKAEVSTNRHILKEKQMGTDSMNL